MDWNLVRIVNCLLALYCVIGVVPARNWWAMQRVYVRFLLLALLGLLLASGYGAVEAIVRDVPGGIRVLVYTPSLAWAAYGITVLNLNLRKEK